jgi:hypothetical protein
MSNSTERRRSWKVYTYSVKKGAPRFYWAWRFATELTIGHLPERGNSCPQLHNAFLNIRFTMLSPHLWIGLPHDLHLWSSAAKRIFSLPLTLVTGPTPLIPLNFVITFGEDWSWSSSLCIFFILLLLLSVRPKYFPFHSVLKHSQSVKMTVFWYVAPCSLLHNDRCFGGSCWPIIMASSKHFWKCR